MAMHTRIPARPSPIRPAPSQLRDGGALQRACAACTRHLQIDEHDATDTMLRSESGIASHDLAGIRILPANRPQPSLRVSQPGDPYEREADRIADQVMRMQRPRIPHQARDADEALPHLHRVHGSHTQSEPPTIRPDAVLPEDSGRRLDEGDREFMEARFGHDFSQVRVHAGPAARDAAAAVNARAYTLGRDIVFGAGEYAPGTDRGRRLLAHELTHVLQQAETTTATGQRLPMSIQRACGPAEIGTAAGCVGRGGDLADFGHSSDDIFLFVVDCDTFQPGERERLGRYAYGIGADTAVEVDGFASEEGPADFNENLSCARAHAAASVLIASGVSPGRISRFMHGATGGLRLTHRSVVITLIEASSRRPERERRPYPNVKVWINSFIPHERVDGPPGYECFAGDGRGFSANPAASSRTHQSMELSASGTTADIRRIGTTHEVSCDTGDVIESDTASEDELTNNAIIGQRTSAQADVFFVADASNPLVSGAPAINLEAEFHLNLATRACIFNIEHDGFPAYEAYISADGGPPVKVYTYDPRAHGETINDLLPPMDWNSTVNVSF